MRVRENKIGQGGSRGRGGGRANAGRRGSRARRAERRNARTWGVRDRATRLGAGVPARSRANAQGPAPGKADVRDTLITERGSAGSGSSRTRGDTPRTSPVGDPRVPWSRGGARLGSRAVRARLVLVRRGSRALRGLIFAPKGFPAHQHRSPWRELSTLIGFRFGFRSIAIGAFSVVLRNSPLVLQFDPEFVMETLYSH